MEVGSGRVGVPAAAKIRAGMGNAAAKDGENGLMAARNGGGSSSAGGAAARPPPLSPPDAVMLEQPPPVPYLFAPQVMMIYCYPKKKEETMI